MPKKVVVKSEMSINAPISRVWEFLLSADRFARLFSPSANAVLEESKSTYTGCLNLGEIQFNLKMSPYDVVLSSESCTIVLRLTDNYKRCHVVMAASFLPESGFSVRERDLYNVLSRLKSVTGYPEDETISQNTHPSGNVRLKTAHLSNAKKPTHALSKKMIASILVACVVIGSAVFLIPKLGKSNDPPEVTSAIGSSDLSDLVNFETINTIALGSSQKEIETALGTNGVSVGSNSYTYRSAAVTNLGQPTEQLRVVYSKGIAVSLTYLNLINSTEINSVTNSFPLVGAGDINQINAAVGYPLSMMRKYTNEGGNEMLEMHYGYLDPFANFDIGWRGEIAVIVNLADGTVINDYCKGYDGGDPLMVNSIKDTPLQNQFDNYTDFLNDKYQFDKAMLMVTRFSRGDVERIFGALTEYDAGSGAVVCQTSSAKKVPGTETPIYNYSFGFESTGTFNMSSYANMRLFSKSDMLKNTRYESVSRNMSYGEVRTLVGLVPTAVYVNDNFVTVCYGKYIEGATTELQFEFVVKLKFTTMFVDSVYNNTVSSEVSPPSTE